MSEKVGAAMIGCGSIGRCHGSGLRLAPNVRFAAVADLYEDRARAYKEEYGAEAYYSNVAEMLKCDDIQFVVVATPVNVHAENTIQALEAGKHVMVQKPMAMSVEECDRMVAAARRNDRKLMNCYVRYFHPAYYQAKRLIDQGAIGDVFIMRSTLAWHMSATHWKMNPAIAGGGIMMDGHVHMVAMVKYYTGEEPESVFVSGGTLASNAVGEDTAIMTLRSKRTVSCIVGSSRLIEPCEQTGRYYKEEIEIHGTKGTIHIMPLKRPSLRLFSEDNRGVGGVNGWIIPRLETVKHQERTSYGHYNGDEDPWTGLHKYFADCVAKNEEPITNGEEGRRYLEIVQAGYESMRSGKVVNV